MGAAILGAVASNKFTSVVEAMAVMNKVGAIIKPAKETEIANYHSAKYQIFLELYKDQIKYQQMF